MRNYNQYLSIWVNNRIYHFVKLFWAFPLSIISRIVPKGEYEIYGSMNGFKVCDNSKFLFHKYNSEKSFFITKNINLIDSSNEKIIYAYSIKGVYLQMFAKKVFWTHGLNDFIAPLIVGSYIVGLQHGLPGKKTVTKNRSELYYKIKNLVLPFMNNDFCHEVWSPKPFYDPYILEVFHPLEVAVKRKQLPRIEFGPYLPKKNKILYAPSHRTFRKIGDVLDGNKVFLKSFLDELNKKEYEFVIRPHPLDYDELVQLNTGDYCLIDLSSDVHDTISSYSIVISDFSGLLIDCWELGIESYCLCDDLENIFDSGIIYEWFFEELKSKRINKMSDIFYHKALKKHKSAESDRIKIS